MSVEVNWEPSRNSIKGYICCTEVFPDNVKKQTST
jgi:hypothetical protein